MTLYADIPGVAIQVSRDVVVASIQVDLDDDVLNRFRDELLHRLHETGSCGVILDVSGVETLDSDEFSALRRIITMVTIMGTESVLVGLQPGVVSALIEVGADVEGLQTAIDLDAAFDLLRSEGVLEPTEYAVLDPILGEGPEADEQRMEEASGGVEAEW